MQTQQERIYLVNYQKQYETEKKRVLNEDIDEHNRQQILQYHTFCFAKGCGQKRVKKLSYQLRYLFSLNKKVLYTWTREDIEGIIATINRREDITQITKGDYRRMLKSFLLWYKKRDFRLEGDNKEQLKAAKNLYEYVSEEIRVNIKNAGIKQQDVITEEDISLVLSKGFEGISNSQRDKAFIALLFETGMRSGEILTMTIGSVIKKEKYALVSISGKTGPRNINIVSSIPYLYAWLNCHPNKQPNSPLWVSLRHRAKVVPMNYPTASAIVSGAWQRVGLNKKCNLHWLRHSAATRLADFLNETQLCQYMGWVIGSREVKTYVKANIKGTNDKVLEMNGLKNKEELKPKNIPINCPICKHVNESMAEFCSQCGHVLDLKTALKYEGRVKDETNKTIELLMEIMKNPELLAKFEAFKQKLQEVQK